MASFLKQTRIYEKHESKFLNSALILYLCFGAFLFNYLGEFNESDNFSMTTNDDIQQNEEYSNKTGVLITAEKEADSNNRRKTTTKSNKPIRDLNELRLTSVRRMWNITNRLNILYESNWTLLVLDELVEFERRLLETLSSREVEISKGGGGQDEDEDEGSGLNVELEIEAESEKESSSSSSSNKRTADKKATSSEIKSGDKSTRSIKKSFFHSLATITTIASPHGSPKTSTGKLATILYGTLGIPILLFTITITGKHLAHSTLNTILIVRHYCFSIPIHYLCCSCNLYLCFRWLSWCCCCCCCSYLCCFTSDRDKAKCCDSKNAPKLKLKTRRKKRSGRSKSLDRYQAPGASGAIYQRNSEHVVGNVNNLHFTDYTNFSNNQQQKSVRFSNQGGKQKSEFDVSQDSIKKLSEISDTDPYIEDEGDEGESLYSSGVFFASLIIVGVYLSAGAYVYSRNNSLTLVDGLFEVYSLLSASKMPDSLNPKEWKEDIMSVYKSLKSNTLLKGPSSKFPDTFKKEKEKQKKDPFGSEAFLWETLYLICGLHLLSMCGHFARLWLSGKISRKLSDCRLKDLSMSAVDCNGHIPSIMGALNENSGAPNSFGDYGQIAGNVEQKASDHYLMQASLPTTQLSPSNPKIESHISINQPGSDISSTQQQQEQPQEVNLAELFVVTSQTASPADLHYATRQQKQQQAASQQQQTSDVSFASTDRSTDRTSLCLHHQAQIPNVSHTQSGTSYYNPSSTYSHQYSSMSQLSQPYIGIQHQHHNHHLNHENQPNSRLYPTFVTNNSGQGMVDEGEGDEDDDEMDIMLKSCLNGSSKLPSSSSLLHLSSKTQNADNCLHQHLHKHPSSTMSYKTNGFGCNHSEQQHNHQRLGSLSRDANRSLRFGLDNGNNGCEQDSSLNTTADANTLSSSSGRTVKIVHNQQHEQSYPNGVQFNVDEASTKRQ